WSQRRPRLTKPSISPCAGWHPRMAAGPDGTGPSRGGLPAPIAGPPWRTADVGSAVRQIVSSLENCVSNSGLLTLLAFCCAPVMGVLSRRAGFGLAASVVVAIFGGIGLLVAVVTWRQAKERRVVERARRAFEERFPAGSPRRAEAVTVLRDMRM